MRAKLLPDGTVEVQGEAYRLVEVARSRFRLERVRDGSALGEVDVASRDAAEGRPVDPAHAAVVQAVAELLDGPRGLLPLQ